MVSKAPLRASRRPPKTVRSIVASSTKIDLGSKRVGRLGRSHQGWQNEVWSYFDEVPEVKYTVRHIGSAMAKLRLVVAWDDPADNRLPAPIFDDGGVLIDAAGLSADLAASAVAELGRLDVHTDGGIPALLEAMNQQFEIVGECWFVGYGPTAVSEEQWEIRSVDEVEQRNDAIWVRDSPDQKQDDQRRLDPTSDTIMRLWVHHPRWRRLADSPLRSAMSDCRALIGLANEIIAETNSQASAGILLMPNEIDDGSPDFTDEEGGDDDPFLTELENALVDPIIDPESPRAVAPILLRGPAADLAEVRHLSFGRDRAETLDKRIEARVTRLARAMNMPPEVVTGLSETTFNNAEQIDEDKWLDHYEPRARLIGAMLTSVYLRPNLVDAGHDPAAVAKLRVWGDGSALIRQPNVEKNASAAHKSLTISDAAYRRAAGFGDADAPDGDEVLRRTATAGTVTGDVTLALLQLLVADRAGLDVTPTVPANLAPGIVAAAAPDVGRRLMELDRDLRARLVVAADGHLARALERAGSKLRTSKHVRGLVASHVPARDVAATLGAAGMSDAGFDAAKLLEGAFDVLRTQWLAWVAATADAALNTAETMIGPIPDRVVVAAGYEAGAETGWVSLLGSLNQLAADRLLGPALSVPAGEINAASQVPDGIIRRAMSVAGGPVEAGPGGGAWVSLTPDGVPAGGVATGDRTIGVLRDGGAVIDGYRWVYGPAIRQQPFVPHESLDGATFINFDDPQLSNTTGWPALAFYAPGDHAGCRCDVSPTIIRSTPRPVIAAAANMTCEETTC